MTEPVFVLPDVVDRMHAIQIEEHGGAAGIRDQGLLESALGRPINLHAYASGNIFKLAAAYAFGLARNHPFMDGNKRTAFLAAYVCLRINGSCWSQARPRRRRRSSRSRQEKSAKRSSATG